MKIRLCLAAPVLFWSGATHAQAPVPGWTANQVESLRHWIAAAPDDALPVLSSAALDAAQRGGDPAAISAAATTLALDLARLHLLGCASTTERAGWRIVDSDGAIDLSARLGAALSGGTLDRFFAGLRPAHPDYAVLRAAFATEADAARRLTLARNMERWRWMPQSLGASHVLVNAAAFEARLVQHGQMVGTWKVIVGKPATPTPVFAATITGVTFNPWWDVPASIVRESVGALVRRNPALARQRGYMWSGGHIRQRPGPGNSLGQVKLEMANPYSVYMHDTPSKQLFDRDVRAFSHGCIRTGDIAGLAVRLMDGRLSPADAEAKIAGRRTETLALPAPVPVYVAYFTAGAGADGKPVFHPDIYGRDGRIGDPSAGIMAVTSDPASAAITACRG